MLMHQADPSKTPSRRCPQSPPRHCKIHCPCLVQCQNVHHNGRENLGDVQANIKAYFDYFHPSLPIIHRPTFQLSSTPKQLLGIIAAIGGLYLRSQSPEDHASSAAQVVHDHVAYGTKLWKQGVVELERIVSTPLPLALSSCVLLTCSMQRNDDWRELRNVWVIQAWLLHIVYGAYASDSTGDGETRRMLRSMVDVRICQPMFLDYVFG